MLCGSVAALVCVGGLFGVSRVKADGINYFTGTGGSWVNSANWSSDTPNTGLYSLAFDNPSLGDTYVGTGFGYQIQDLSFKTGTSSFAVNAFGFSTSSTTTLTFFGTSAGVVNANGTTDTINVDQSATGTITFGKPGTGTLQLKLQDTHGNRIVVENDAANLVIGPGAYITTTTGFTKSGAGTLTLQSANTITGPVVVSGGTLSLQNSAALGSANSLTVYGILQFSAANTVDYSSIFSTANFQYFGIDTNGQTVTFATGINSSNGSLEKLGAGTLILTGNNGYTGATTITAGTLQIGNGGATGAISGSSAVTNNSNLVVNTSNSFALGSSLAGTGTITLSGGGNTTITNAGAFTGSIDVLTGTTISFGGSDTFGTFAQVATSTLTIESGAIGTNTGASFNTINNLTINGGELRAVGGQSSTFPAYQLKGTVTVGGAGASSFTAPGTTNSFTAIQLGNNSAGGITTFNIVNPTATLTIAPALVDGRNSAGTATVASGLTLTGAGKLILTGASTYSGPTTIAGGTLQINGSIYGTSGPGAIDVMNGGTLALARNDTFGSHTVVPASTITIESGGLVTNTGGYFTTLNNLTFNGGELRANGGANATFPAYSLKGTVTANGSVSSTISATTTYNTFNTVQIGNNVAGGVTTFNVTDYYGSLNIAQALRDSENVGVTATVASGLTKIGYGTLLLAGNNTYTGPTTISQGTLQIGNGGSTGALTSGAPVTVNGSLIINTSNSFTLGNSVTGSGYIQLTGGGVTTFPNASTFTGYIDVASGGTLKLVLDGTFGNYLSVPTMGVRIEAGGLITNAAPSFNVFNNLTINGGELRANGGTSATFPAYSLKGTVSANGTVPSVISATTTVNAFNSIQIGNNVAGGVTTFYVGDSAGSLSIGTVLADSENAAITATVASGLTKTGSGLLVLSAANTYTGPTIINGGTLRLDGSIYGSGGAGTIDVQSGTLLLSHGNTFGTFTSSPVTSITLEANGVLTNNAAVFNVLNNLKFNGGVLDANGGLSSLFQAYLLKGTVTVDGLGVSTITASSTVNSFTGVQLGNNTAGGVTTFNVLKATGQLGVDATLMDGMNTAGTATVASGLTKTGPGVLYLSGANTYTGITTVSGGTLITGPLNNGGGAGAVGMTSSAASNLIINGATLQDAGASDVTDRLFTIGTSGGELDSGADVTFTNTGAIVLAGSNTARTFTLGGSGNGSLAATLGNNGSGLTSFVKTGTGTWNLSSAQSYTGGTTIRGGGTLQLDFTQPNSPLSNILLASPPLTLSDGILSALGSNTADSSQTFNGITLNGATGIQASPGTGHTVTLNLGAITRNAGAITFFNPPSAGGITTSSGSASSLLTDGNGTPYGVIGDDWAAKDATNTRIVPGSTLPGFYSSSLTGNAQFYSSVTAPDGTTQLTSLYLASSANVSLKTGSKLLTPGILVASNSISTIGGGALGSPTGELVAFVNAGGVLFLPTGVIDAGHTTGLTKAGAGYLSLPGAQSYTGATYINGGTAELNGTINTPSANITVDGLNSQAPTFMLNSYTSGIASASASNLYIGVNGVGSVSVNNTSRLTLGQNIYLGTASGSSGSLAVNFQAVLQATSIIGGQGYSTVALQNGILRATASTTELLSGITYLTGGGTGYIDTNGNNAVSISLPLQGSWDLKQIGAGTLSLSAANPIKGNIFSNGGALRLDFSRSGAPLNDIVPSSDTLYLNNGTLAIQGSNSTASSQTFPFIQLYGATAVRLTSGTGGATTLNLTYFFPSNNNATLDFTLPANGSIQTQWFSTANSIVTFNSIPFATVNGTDWAATDATQVHFVAGSSIAGFYTPATATSLSGNADVAAGVTSITLPAAPPSITSLRFNRAQATTLTIGSTDTFSLGGLLVTSAVGNNVTQINGGTLQATGAALAIIQNNTAAALNIASNVNAPLLKSGPGALTLSGTVQNNSALSIMQGAVTVTGTVQGAGSILIDGPFASPASLAVTGSGSVSASKITVGDITTGSILQNGGTVQLSGQLTLGNYTNPGSTATYTLNSGSLTAGQLSFDRNASFIQNGGSVQATSLFTSPFNGAYTLSAGSLTLSSFSWNGNFVQTGGTMSESNFSNLNGTFQQTGGTRTVGASSMQTSQYSTYLLSGSATLNVPSKESLSGMFTQNGGTNITPTITLFSGSVYNLNGGLLQLKSASIAGTFNLNGGTLQFAASNNNSLNGIVHVQSGGAIIDTNGFSPAVGSFFHDDSGATPAIDGGLTKIGAGTLRLTGGSNYTGPTKLNSGGVVLSGSLNGTANLNVGDGVQAVTLGGNGSITPGNGGAVTIASGAILAPAIGNATGLSINAAVSSTASLAFQSGSTFQLSMANNQPGAPSLNDYAKLTIGTGVAVTLGGNIITNFDGPLHNGDLFTIVILNGGTLTGTFANTTTAAPNSAGSTFRFSSNGLLWDINYAWNGSLPLSGMDPTAFEQTTGGNNVALLLVQVPEPGTLVSLLGSCTLLLGWRRRGRRAL